MQCTLDAQHIRKYRYHFHAAISFVGLMGGTDTPFLLIEEWNRRCTSVNSALLLEVWMQPRALMSPSGFRNLLELPFFEFNSLKPNIVTNPDILSAFKCKSTSDSILSAKSSHVIWFTRRKLSKDSVSIFWTIKISVLNNLHPELPKLFQETNKKSLAVKSKLDGIARESTAK